MKKPNVGLQRTAASRGMKFASLAAVLLMVFGTIGCRTSSASAKKFIMTENCAIGRWLSPTLSDGSSYTLSLAEGGKGSLVVCSDFNTNYYGLYDVAWSIKQAPPFLQVNSKYAGGSLRIQKVEVEYHGRLLKLKAQPEHMAGRHVVFLESETNLVARLERVNQLLASRESGEKELGR